MAYRYIKAHRFSFGQKRNKKRDVKYIVIHYTGNIGDTAENNAKYFTNPHYRYVRGRKIPINAGAHFFVDRSGHVVKSIAMELIAWSVGGLFTRKNGAGKYYRKCTNANSVSIELCDIANKYPSDAQIKAVKKLIKYIRKYCPNAKTVIRHWDVNGKNCPGRMSGKDNKEWNRFLKAVGEA